MTNTVEVGDVIEYGPNKVRRRVVGVRGQWLWLGYLDDEDSPPGTGHVSEGAKKVTPFFEPGKTYQRHLDFSIRAQRRDVTEYFKVETVRENSPGRGGRVAFGEVTFNVCVDGLTVNQWEIMGNYDWNNNGWKPA